MKGFLEMSKNTEQHTPYTDDLVTPIMLKPVSVVNSQQDNQAYIYSEINRKFSLVHERYGLKKENTQAYQQLLLCLLDKHVKAFQVIYPRREPMKNVGRPSLWKGTKGITLYADIFKEKKNGANNSQSCEALSLTPRYKDYNARLLYNRYCSFRRDYGQSYCTALDELLEVLPRSFGSNFLGAYLPDGSALLESIDMVKIWVKFFSELVR